MKESLYIDLYKNGYSKEMLDCIDIPLAAAAGYYKYENYYFYGLLTGVERNWGTPQLMEYEGLDYRIVSRNQKVLKKMGLQMVPHLIDNKDDVLEQIKESLHRRVPVLLFVQYCSLFYNIYYKDKTGKNLHLLLIDGYDSDREIFRVRDNAFLRGVEITENETDIMFPIQLTKSMLMDIWNYNVEDDVDDFMNLYLNRFFTLEQIDTPSNNNFTCVLEDVIKKVSEEKSNLISLVDDECRLLMDAMKDTEFYLLNFIGNMKGMFRALDCLLDNSCYADFMNEEYETFKKNYIKCREKHFMAMYKGFFKSRRLTEEFIQRFVHEEEQNDQELLTLLTNIYGKESKEEKKEYVKVDLMSHYNNIGFTLPDSKNSEADLTGNGIYFVFDNDLRNILQTNLNFQMSDKTSEEQKDNISCCGQTISIPEGDYHTVSILACSEYGSYTEDIQFMHQGMCVEKLTVSVSDFYQFPLFGESIFWVGDAYQRKECADEHLNFNAKIFQYEYRLQGKTVDAIKLCNRKNIHIFAICIV